MATCEEIKKAAKVVYPSSAYRGWLDLSPPVRLVHRDNGAVMGAWALNEQEQRVMVVGRDTLPVSWVRVHSVQGRMRGEGLSEELWDQLEKFLNRVADEREQDDDGPGSMPTQNAEDARYMLDKLWLTRRKPKHIV